MRTVRATSFGRHSAGGTSLRTPEAGPTVMDTVMKFLKVWVAECGGPDDNA